MQTSRIHRAPAWHRGPAGSDHRATERTVAGASFCPRRRGRSATGEAYRAYDQPGDAHLLDPKNTSLPTPTTARILGVDDWAKRKGKIYATALVDLERHRLIELLPDREAETLSCWLQKNPGTEVISRERSEKYAVGGRQGAPGAVHVADRWHLLSNWREATEHVFDRHRGQVKQVILPKPEPVNKPAAAALPAKSVNRRRKYLEEKRARAQAERQARYDVIRERCAKGEYLKTIATDLGITYRTARKYALSEECPTRKPMPKRPRMLEPYEPYLKARWEQGCKNGKQLYREIVAHGFPGSRTPVAAFVAGLRREDNEGKPQSPPATGEPLTPRKASTLVLRRPDRLTDAERMALAHLRDAHPDVGTTLAFTERFAGIVRERRGGGELEQWLVDAEASEVREVRQFAHKVRQGQDEAAVRAGCTLEWSNGQTEGKITKLKII